MHFVGADQRHGFTRRLVGDITPTNHTAYHTREIDGLPWNRGRIEQLAVKCMGGGDSTVLEYDLAVTRAAVEYLQEDYDRPQFLCVGMYAPHFPYIAPKKLFSYYYDRVKLPEGSWNVPEHPIFHGKFRDTDPGTVRAAMAAYYGMTQFMDDNIGSILKAWREFCTRRGREGVVIYVSDHGDMNGEHGFYGKNTFYESSVHVPMIFSGSGIASAHKVTGPVSLLDLGPTICEMAGTELLPHQDGVSLWKEIHTGADSDPNRIVIAELANRFGAESIGRMAVGERYKFVTYSGFADDQLYDLPSDPYECRNVNSEHPDISEIMRKALKEAGLVPDSVLIHQMQENASDLKIIQKSREEEKEEWKCPDGLAETPPDPAYSSKVPLTFRNA